MRQAEIHVYGAWHTYENCVRKQNPFGLFEVPDVVGIGQRIANPTDFRAIPGKVQELPVFGKHTEAVGYVLERSSVDKLRFAIYPHRNVRRGDVVGVSSPTANPDDDGVYYQVLDVITSDEEPTKPPFAMQYASAAQLGSAESSGRFRTHQLTPYTRTPVWSEGGEVESAEVEIASNIGALPGTEIPVNIDLNALVAYHTAILGTTGSGKTTLLRALIPRIASHGIHYRTLFERASFRPGLRHF